jgi:murein DD-endopeptidase MepM/ murein hydrolase activator NlpD
VKKKSSKKVPGAFRGKGRFGFITVVFLMLGAAVLLTVSAGNRHAMVAWGSLPHEKPSGEPEAQDPRFIVVDVSDAKVEEDAEPDVPRSAATASGGRNGAPVAGRESVSGVLPPVSASLLAGRGIEKALRSVPPVAPAVPSPVPEKTPLVVMLPKETRVPAVPAAARTMGVPLREGAKTSVSSLPSSVPEADVPSYLGISNASSFVSHDVSKHADGEKPDVTPFSEKTIPDYDVIELKADDTVTKLPELDELEDASDDKGGDEIVLHPVRPDWTEHTVRSGETLSDIALKYGVRTDSVVRANELKSPDRLADKQLLLVPNSDDGVEATLEEVRTRKARIAEKLDQAKPLHVTTYVVGAGDSLWSIANRFNVEIDTIFGSNPLRNPDVLKPGMALRVPNQDGIFVTIRKGETVDQLAKKYKISAAKIRSVNAGADLAILVPGRELFLPGAAPEATTSADDDSKPVVKAEKNVSRGFRWPLIGKINSPFGWRRHPISRRRQFHTGMDIKGPRGRAIHAAKAGRVVYVGWMSGYGRTVVVNHGNGYSSFYAHCQTLNVRQGQAVTPNSVIASVGSSGRATGTHLHFEVRLNNRPINPRKLLR